MAAPDGLVRPWWRDPIVWLGVVVGVLASGVAFFAGRYLPYNDWAGHLGCIAVLADGDVTGADQYMVRTFRPSPYWYFYVTTALGSKLVAVEIAAKLNLLFATAMMTIGAARLAQVSGTSPRLALFAPLALFGSSLGAGFSSFVGASFVLVWVAADLEHVLLSIERGPVSRRALAFVMAELVLAYLGHGLLFLFAALQVGVRVGVFALIRWREHRSISARGLGLAALGFLPALIVGGPSILRRIISPYVTPEFQRSGGPALAGWNSIEDRLRRIPIDLLDRGGPDHGTTMIMVVGISLLAYAAVRWLGREPSLRSRRGLVVHAIVLGSIFALAPKWLGWPVSFWVINQRAAPFFVLFLILLVPTRLDGRWGTALAGLALIPVLHNGLANARIIAEFSGWAASYDIVRETVPPGQRVLPLFFAGLPTGRARPAATQLGFYHLVDGAKYVPIGAFPPEVPVHRDPTVKAPNLPSTANFDPRIHGLQYDYLVLRGAHLRQRTERAGVHELVKNVDGWLVYRTLR